MSVETIMGGLVRCREWLCALITDQLCAVNTSIVREFSRVQRALGEQVDLTRNLVNVSEIQLNLARKPQEPFCRAIVKLNLAPAGGVCLLTQSKCAAFVDNFAMSFDIEGNWSWGYVDIIVVDHGSGVVVGDVFLGKQVVCQKGIGVVSFRGPIENGVVLRVNLMAIKGTTLVGL